MVYRYISSKNIIAEIYDEGIKTTDWEGRIANWCLKAIRKLNCIRVLWERPIPITVNDYTVKISDYIHSIRSIEYNKQKMYEIRKTRPIERDEPLYLRSYTITNGNINFAFTDKEVTINTLYYPIEYDEKTKAYFPLYPDLEEVAEYLKLYCIRNIMLRGYEHPRYSFNVLNNETNINILAEKARKAARKKVNQMNNEERRRISDILTTMDTPSNVDVTKLFW